MGDKTTIELISEVQEFADLHKFMEDDDVDKALEYVVKLIANPNIPGVAATRAILQLQAISAKCGILASYYTNVNKDREVAKRKNVYYSMRDAIDKLVDALKYTARNT